MYERGTVMERIEMLEEALKEANDNCRKADYQKILIEDFYRLVKKIDKHGQEIQDYKEMRKFLTESMYHTLCETPLEKQEILGMVLGELLGFSFKERQVNCFVYTLDNGWELEVPTYNGSFVKLIIQQFLKQNIEENFDFRMAMCSLKDSKAKMKRWEAYLTASDRQKANMIYVGAKDYPVYTFLLFKVANITGKYDRKVKEILTDCAESCRINTAKMKSVYEEYAKQYKEQADQLRYYADILLGWTNTIMVYRSCDRGYPSMNCMTIHTLEDIPKEAKLPPLTSLTGKE